MGQELDSKEPLTLEPGLSVKAIRSGLWVSLLSVFGHILGLARIVVLARILAPHDFGLLGIALLTMSILESFSTSGFHGALIQKKEGVRAYLDVAWTVLSLRGLALAAALYLIAPYAAFFFRAPEAAPVMRVVGLSVFFQGLTNIGVVYFKKELRFDKEFIYQISGAITDFIVAVSAALILRNAWALILGLLAGNLARCLASYIIHPYRPRFNFEFKKARELFTFGKWMLGSCILTFLLMQGDDLFVAKFFGVAALGFYQMAYRISNMPATEVTNVIGQVTFPLYSKLQDDIPKLREAYLRVLGLISFLSFPIAVFIFVLAPDFTRIFLGVKWMPMVPAMQALSLWGGIRSVGATTGTLFCGVGKPKTLTGIQSVHLGLLAAFIYPLSVKWGILGTSMAVVLAALAPVMWAFYGAAKIIKCTTTDLLEATAFPLAGTAGMVLAVSALKTYWKNSTGIPQFFLLVLAGAAAYLAASYLLDRFSGRKMQGVIKDSLFAFMGRKDA